MLTQRDEENHDALREEDVWKLDLQELYEGDIDDVLHTVSGNTHAENLCHAIVRCTVQNALLQDQRVQPSSSSGQKTPVPSLRHSDSPMPWQ
jgi:hypothetical protein